MYYFAILKNGAIISNKKLQELKVIYESIDVLYNNELLDRVLWFVYADQGYSDEDIKKIKQMSSHGITEFYSRITPIRLKNNKFTSVVKLLSEDIFRMIDSDEL